MGTCVIKKGTHQAKPLKFGVYYNKRNFDWEVEFDASAKYYIGSKQLDINKLCGVRYLFGDNSARFGWRYDPAFPNMIEIMAYVHDNGRVTKSEDEVSIARIEINSITWLHLIIADDTYNFFCKGQKVVVPKTHNQKIGFRQNPYFGGTETATHDIKMKLKKV